MTKHQRLVLDAKDIPEAVHEAMEQLKTGRPRPVEIEVPPETLYDIADVELLEEGKYLGSLLMSVVKELKMADVDTFHAAVSSINVEVPGR